MEHSTIWILMCLFATQVRWVDADAYLLVVDVDNGTIYKGSILQGLTDLAPLPLDGVINPVAVDYDPVEGMVYWTDVGNPSPKISKAHLDGSGQMILVYELNVPGGLALDVTSRMVYWTDELGHIARIPMDGSGRKEIIVENIIRPRGIITDHDNGHIYWTDLGNNGTIERANLDGTDRTVIVQDNMLFPSGLAIDHRENKLYWCDSKLETIEQRDLSSNIRTVVIDLSPFNGTFFPFDLFLFNDNLYWTDWGTYTILRVSKRGTGEQLYGPAIFERAGGIHIYEAKQGCSRPPPSKHMTMSETNSFFQPGEEVLLTCDNGYVIQGSNDHSIRRVCSAADGSWSGGEAQCVIDMEEGGSSYALIIGVASAVALVVVVLLIVLIFIKRKRTRRTNERVVHLPDVQTIYQGGQTNPQFQAVNPPPYQSRQPIYQDSIYTDLKDPSPYQQTSNL